MKTTLKYWASVGLALVVVSCGIISAQPFGGGSDLIGLASKIGGKARERIPECNALADVTTIDFNQERSLGGAAMIGFGAKFGGLQLDIPTQMRGLSMEQLRTMLRDDAEEYKFSVGISKTPSHRLHRNLATIGWRLAEFSDRPTLPWTFCVINNQGINAYSAPGGYVCVTEGLLKTVNNEAELACVLAHEIGHVVKKHGPVEYGKIKQHQCLTMLAGDVAGDLVQVNINFGQYFDLNHASKELVQKLVDAFVEKLVDSGFGKDAEFEADAYGFELASLAGYDRKACQTFLNRLPSGDSAIFANHPPAAERVQRLADLEDQNKDSFGFLEDGVTPPWSLESARTSK